MKAVEVTIFWNRKCKHLVLKQEIYFKQFEINKETSKETFVLKSTALLGVGSRVTLLDFRQNNEKLVFDSYSQTAYPSLLPTT